MLTDFITKAYSTLSFNMCIDLDLQYEIKQSIMKKYGK